MKSQLKRINLEVRHIMKKLEHNVRQRKEMRKLLLKTLKKCSKSKLKK